jgi:hypothetical protein
MSFSDVINSGVATIVAEFATLPICTVKTQYQNSTSIQHKSIIETIYSIYKTSGFKGFYKASFPAISSQALSTSSKWFFYRYLNDNNMSFINPEYKNTCRVVNFVIGGIGASLITHPIDFIKIHMQMDANIRSVIRKEGLPVFYRGYSKSFSKVILGSMLYFPLTDAINDRLNNTFLSAFITGIVATTIIQPIDYMKTRQVYGNQFNFKISGLYKGLSLNLCIIVPHYTIVMGLTDYMKRYHYFN